MTKRLMWSLLLAMLVIMTVSVMLTVSATSKVLTGRQELLLREVVDIVSNGFMVGERTLSKGSTPTTTESR